MNSISKLFVLCLSVFSLSASAGIATISTDRQVDLLFLVDDSASMGTHQATLKSYLPRIIENYQDTDLQVGIISSSLRKENPAFLGRNLSGSFQQVATDIAEDLVVGINGDAREKFFEPIIWSLTSQTNAGFIRTGAKLVIVVVSDADDQSDMTSIDFLMTLNTIKPIAQVELYSFRSLSENCYIDPTPGSPLSSPGYEKIGPVLNLLNAKSFDLCGDWATYKLN